MRNLIYILFCGLLFLSSCSNKNENIQPFNEKAKLPAGFKFDTLGLKVMSSYVNNKSGTMSTLYANRFALSNALKGDKSHRAAEVFALVTWKQQADGYWFGADIPGDLQSVELIKTATNSNNTLITYKKYNGGNLELDPDTAYPGERIHYILDQQPSIMP